MNKCRQNKFCGVWTRAKFGQSSDYEVKFIEKGVEVTTRKTWMLGCDIYT